MASLSDVRAAILDIDMIDVDTEDAGTSLIAVGRELIQARPLVGRSREALR
jgi:hypothetical protein